MPTDTPSFEFCVCPDAALASAHLAEAFPLGAGLAGRKVFWADEGLESSFWSALSLQQLDMRKWLLVVRNAQLLNTETWKRISSALARPLSSSLPVFCLEVPWEKGAPRVPAAVAKLKCYQFAQKKQWIWENPGLTAKTVQAYLSREMKRRSLSADSQTVARLAEIAIPSASAVDCLLDQLALASEDGAIRRELVADMSAFTPDAVIFDLIRCLENGNPAAAWKLVLSQGDSAEALLFPLLTLMAREARMLWQMKAGEKTFCQPFLEAEKRRLASRLGFGGISRLINMLFAAEGGVKSGRFQPMQAFEFLTAEMTLLFTQVSRHA